MKVYYSVTLAVICFLVMGLAPVAHSQDKAAKPAAELYTSLAEKKDIMVDQIAPGLDVGVLLEIEATYNKQDESESDLKLATFELGIDGVLVPGISGHVLLLWEEDDTEPIDLDEGYITLGATEDMPAFLSVGKMYVPFGAFNSFFISDPVVLTLGETRETAALLGFENELVLASVGAFSGDVRAQGENNKINKGVASLAINAPMPDNMGFQCGTYWISDIGESDELQDMIGDEQESYDQVNGIGGYALLTIDMFTLNGEYIAAIDDFDAGQLAEETQKPSAWNLEGGVAPSEQWEFALRLEGSSDFPGQPETQYGGVVSYGIVEGATIAVEYLHGTYEGDASDSDAATAQLSVEF